MTQVPSTDVLMFGGRGAGKTSLLASMMHAANQLLVRGGYSLSVLPTGPDADELNMVVEKLRAAMTLAPDVSSFRVIPGTVDDPGRELTGARTRSCDRWTG